MGRTGRVSRPAARFDDEAGSGLGPARMYRSAMPAAAPSSDVDEWHVPDFAAVGSRIKARGWHAGVTKDFVAEVVAIRPRYPRVHVRFVQDVATGSSHPLALPQPVEAYLHHGAIEEL